MARTFSLPSETGNANRYLQVKSTEDGLQWTAQSPSGYSGYSGFSGISGYSGFSGISGYSGFSGISGYSGFSGISGYSGISGFSGFSGISGFSGYSGFSGISGYSGFSGISGYSGPAVLTQNSQSTAYTTVAGDAGKHILHPTADNNPRTFTIDSNANVAYTIGTTITFVNQINTVTIAITSDTLTQAGSGSTGSRTLAAFGIATALKLAATVWIISGTGLS